ncbi:MAG: fatty acid desaturase, partial [Phycisphaeraceae bacterium]
MMPQEAVSPQDAASQDAGPQDAKVPGRIHRLRHKLDWPVIIGIGGLHVAAIAAPWFFSWSALTVALVLYWISGGLGVTLGFHRLLTHRSFKTPKWLEYTLTAFGCLAWQGGPATWVGTHRIHHKHSDSDLDPHTPNHGFTWSHIFWCMHKEPEGQNAAAAAKDLLRDPFIRRLNRHFWVPQAILAVVLLAGGELARYFGLNASGLSWVIWGVALRTVLVYHATWFVNSASHTWGYQTFETGDRSTNLWWVALLSFGEGWHNNHHAHPRSAAHGQNWYEIDIPYLTI